MFKGRRFAIANPVKPRYSSESRVSKRPSSSSSGRRSCQWSEGDSYDGPHDDDGVYSTIDDLDYLAEIREDDGTVEDLISRFSDEPAPRSRRAKSPHPLRVVYIVSQSNTDILSLENEGLVAKKPGEMEPCIDKVISVHATKLSANAAAKAHLRKTCGVEDWSSSDGEYRDDDNNEYHEGVGARGVFVGFMQKQLKRGGVDFVRVETKLWSVEK